VTVRVDSRTPGAGIFMLRAAWKFYPPFRREKYLLMRENMV